MGIMRYDSEVSSDVIKCHQMSSDVFAVQRMKKKKQVSSTLEECLLHVFVKWVHRIKNPIYFNAYRIFRT